MRTTINLADDMFILAQQTAQRERISLGEAVAQWMRRGASAGDGVQERSSPGAALRSPYSIIAARDEVITSEQVYRLMEQEGI